MSIVSARIHHEQAKDLETTLLTKLKDAGYDVIEVYDGLAIRDKEGARIKVQIKDRFARNYRQDHLGNSIVFGDHGHNQITFSQDKNGRWPWASIIRHADELFKYAIKRDEQIKVERIIEDANENLAEDLRQEFNLKRKGIFGFAVRGSSASNPGKVYIDPPDFINVTPEHARTIISAFIAAGVLD